jgi:hypothetical protein
MPASVVAAAARETLRLGGDLDSAMRKAGGGSAR